MRLIDADALYELLDGGYDVDLDELPETKAELLRMIDQEETIDAEPVVRCKDCVSYGTSISGVPCEGYCKQLEYTTRKDGDFCSWGRRKNEAD